MANIQLSVDLGSKFITICQKGVGLVLREPCIAIAQKTKDRLEIREAGFRAESIISNALGGAKVVSPVHEGFIVDEEMFTLLLKHFLKKILPESIIPPRVKAIVNITCAMTNSDRRDRSRTGRGNRRRIADPPYLCLYKQRCIRHRCSAQACAHVPGRHGWYRS